MWGDVEAPYSSKDDMIGLQGLLSQSGSHERPNDGGGRAGDFARERRWKAIPQEVVGRRAVFRRFVGMRMLHVRKQ
jgi:hypothetical protein